MSAVERGPVDLERQQQVALVVDLARGAQARDLVLLARGGLRARPRVADRGAGRRGTGGQEPQREQRGRDQPAAHDRLSDVSAGRAGSRPSRGVAALAGGARTDSKSKSGSTIASVAASSDAVMNSGVRGCRFRRVSRYLAEEWKRRSAHERAGGGVPIPPYPILAKTRPPGRCRAPPGPHKREQGRASRRE